MADPSLMQRRGILCVVSGPSGSGKTTVCRALSGSDPACVYSISCTTRAPRTGEVDGIDYHFLSEDDFAERAVRGDFLEYARVHGRGYGTLKSWVLAHLAAGRDVLMDIDTQGAELIRKCDDPLIQTSLVDVFILPPSIEELRCRLFGRATESEEQMALRLKNALDEMSHWREYAYTIVSASKEGDLAQFAAIVGAERCRTRLLTPTKTGAGPAGQAELFDLL